LGLHYLDPSKPTYDLQEARLFFEYHISLYYAFDESGDEKLCDKSIDDMFAMAKFFYNRSQSRYDPYIALNIMDNLWYRKSESGNDKAIDEFYHKLKKELNP